MPEKIIGTKSLATLFFETTKQEVSRGAELRAQGAFTTSEFADYMGWTINRTHNWLRQRGVRSEVAYDPGTKRNVCFFFPPQPKK